MIRQSRIGDVKMKTIEFIARLVIKIELIVGLFFVMAGGFAVENDMAFATKMVIIGILLAAPDIILEIVDGICVDE